MDEELFPAGRSSRTKGRLNFYGGEFCYRRNLICTNSATPIDGVARRGIVAHEFTHFLQHCSTPYGLFLDELNFQRVALAQEFLKRWPGVVFTPVYKWVQAYRHSAIKLPPDADADLFEYLIATIVRPWSASQFVESILEGCNLAEVRESTTGKAARALEICEKELDIDSGANDVHSSSSGLISANSTELACPFVPFATTDADNAISLPFGALHVMEATAQCVEGFQSSFDSNRSPDYLLALGMLLNRLQDAEDDDYTSEVVIATLLGLCDLALFTPLGRIFRPLRHGGMNWPDLHPGHRFVRGLDSIARRRAWIESVDDAERLADGVCAELNWPVPRDFLKIGAALQHPYFSRYAEACEVRWEDYAIYKPDLVAGQTRLTRFLEEYMPMIGYGDYGTVCGYPDRIDGEQVPLKQIRNCFVNQLAWNVMGDAAGVAGEFFPPDLRFDLYFTNIGGIEDFWGLFAESRIWAQRSRFELLARGAVY